MRWSARGGAIVAPDPRAMLALAATSRARRGVVWAVVLSCALHVAIASLFAVRWSSAAPPAEFAPIEVALLREPASEPVASPAPPAPTLARVVPPPPAPVAKSSPPRRVATKPVPAPVPAASRAPAPTAAEVPPAPPALASGMGNPTAALSAAPPVIGRGHASGGADPVASYVASVLRRIETKKRYPTLARSRGVEGTVVVTLWISPAGGLERLEVGNGASPLLVSSTREAVEKASPFPPPPDGMPSIRIPIRYALRAGNGSP